MCNQYEPAPLEYLEQEWRQYERTLRAYKPKIGPRDFAPFVTSNRVIVGQWGMIRPGSPVRVPTDAKGRPLMTNNARIESVATKPTYRDAWKQGKRCLIPAIGYLEPYWGTGKNIWWRFARKDGQPWTLGGLWSEWSDKETGEVVPSFTMLTMNCDSHPLLNQFHKPDPTLPPDQQDKRSVISIERDDWDTWVSGTIEDAMRLVQLPAKELFAHGADDPTKAVTLPVM